MQILWITATVHQRVGKGKRIRRGIPELDDIEELIKDETSIRHRLWGRMKYMEEIEVEEENEEIEMKMSSDEEE